MKTLLAFAMLSCSIAFTENMMSLEEIAKFDVKSIDCTKLQQLNLIEQQMQQWEDLLKHQKAITHDMKILKSMINLLSHKQSSFLEAQGKISSKTLLKKLHKLELPQTKSKIGLAQVQTLKEICQNIDSEDPEQRAEAKKELCKLLKEYVKNLNNCKQQCTNSPVTIIKIKGQIKDLEIIRDGCQNGKVTAIKVLRNDGENEQYTINKDGEAVKSE